MRPLSATALLDVWERGRGQSLARRAVALLGAACPGEDPESWLIGDRDARLLLLREWAFGASMRGLAECPQCAEPVELALRTDQLRATGERVPEFTLREGNEVLEVRMPTAGDLIAIAGIAAEKGDAEAARALLQRCVPNRDTRELSSAVREAIAHRMAESDSSANIELELDCPACRHRWLAPFDVAAFFWREIEAWARGALAQVHTLASVYGWSEREILSLTPLRRQYYMELALG